MHHFLAMEGLQAGADLLDDTAHRFKVGLWIVDHPLGERLPVDIFHRDIEKVALARSRLEHMRAVDAPRHPFFHHEAFKVFGISCISTAGILRRQNSRSRRRWRDRRGFGPRHAIAG